MARAAPSYIVLKTPVLDGGATIALQVTCAVFLPCIPSRETLIESVNSFVGPPRQTVDRGRT